MTAENDWQTLVNIAHAQAVRGISPLRAIVSYRNLGALLAERVSRQADRPLLLAGRAGGATYRDFQALARQVALRLHHDLRLWKSDRVAVLADDSADLAVLCMAAWQIGVCIVPVPAVDDDRRIAENLREARVRRIVHSAGYAGRAANLSRHLAAPAEPLALEALVRAAESGGERAVPNDPARDDEAFLPFVPLGGGMAGVRLNHYNVIVTADSLARWNHWTPFDRIASSLPLCTTTGLVGTLAAPLSAGASIAIVPFEPMRYWAQLAEADATAALLLPGQLQALLELPDGRPPARLRSVVCAGGPVLAGVVRAFERRFGVPVQTSGGCAQTSGWAFETPPDWDADARTRWHAGEGRAPAGLALDVCEAQFDEGVGALRVRGHNVMQGYDQRPEANRAAFASRWLDAALGGRAVTDTDGQIVAYLDARADACAERDGVPLSLADVDAVLAGLPAARVALAVAFDNAYAGEEIGAYVTPQPGVHLSADTVLSQARRSLGYAKSPKVIVFGPEPAAGARGIYDRRALQSFFEIYRLTRFDEPDHRAPVEGK